MRFDVMDLVGVGRPPRLLLIHGRSADWLDLKDWLREEAGLSEVTVMGQVFGSGESLPEKFERLASEVDGAIAVATPDDIGGLAGPLQDKSPRTRQNVWLEVGWFWGRLGRGRFMVLSSGSVEIPSDLHGLELYPYVSRPREQADRLRAFIKRLDS
jgi:predicted nucleotide-binding protein